MGKMKIPNGARQVSIYLPKEIISKAEQATTLRADGLRQTMAGKIREWIIKGMENESSSVR